MGRCPHARLPPCAVRLHPCPSIMPLRPIQSEQSASRAPGITCVVKDHSQSDAPEPAEQRPGNERWDDDAAGDHCAGAISSKAEVDDKIREEDVGWQQMPGVPREQQFDLHTRILLECQGRVPQGVYAAGGSRGVVRCGDISCHGVAVFMRCVVLRCVALCCVVLCCVVLCCVVLCCVVLCCVALCCVVLCCVVLCCVVLCCVVLCCVVLRYDVPRHVLLCCAVLCCGELCYVVTRGIVWFRCSALCCDSDVVWGSHHNTTQYSTPRYTTTTTTPRCTTPQPHHATACATHHPARPHSVQHPSVSCPSAAPHKPSHSRMHTHSGSGPGLRTYLLL